MTKDCYYCGLQFSNDAGFCPSCGRCLEKNAQIRVPPYTAQTDILRKELKEKDELIRRLAFTHSPAKYRISHKMSRHSRP